MSAREGARFIDRHTGHSRDETYSRAFVRVPTVARRTREIGVRVALGVSRQLIVTAIFRRPLIQVSGGVIAGGFLVGLITVVLSAPPDSGSAGLVAAVRAFTLGQVGQIVAFATLMMGVCLLACIVPTRRALGVEPTEALRVE